MKSVIIVIVIAILIFKCLPIVSVRVNIPIVSMDYETYRNDWSKRINGPHLNGVKATSPEEIHLRFGELG